MKTNNKNTKKSNSEFDTTVTFEEKKHTLREQLGQCWARASKSYFPLTPLQKELEREKYEPLEGYSPADAMVRYKELLIEYEKDKKVVGFFEAEHRTKDIQINLDRVVIDNQSIIPKGGAFDKITPIDATAREVANLICAYTKVDKDDHILHVAKPNEYKLVGLPHLDLVKIRQLVNSTDRDVVAARDVIYAKLKDPKNIVRLLNISSYILSNPMLTRLRVKVDSPKVVESYKRAMADPSFIKTADIYTFKQSAMEVVSYSSPDQCWVYKSYVTKVRGIDRKVGALSSGYYRYDVGAAHASVIAEATDLFMLCKLLKKKAVKLDTPDYDLARVLVHNGITVYAPAMTTKLAPTPRFVDKKIIKSDELESDGIALTTSSVRRTTENTECDYGAPGLYYSGTQSFFVYVSLRQTQPSVDKTAVTYPNPMVIPVGTVTVVAEYIPRVFEAYTYLPSCRVESGICLKTNAQGLESAKMIELCSRFSKAVTFRSWFLFTRFTFVSQDIFRLMFDYPFKYPKLKMEVARLDMSSALHEEVVLAGESALYDVKEFTSELEIVIDTRELLLDIEAAKNYLVEVATFTAAQLKVLLAGIVNNNLPNERDHILMALGQAKAAEEVLTMLTNKEKEEEEARRLERQRLREMERTDEQHRSDNEENLDGGQEFDVGDAHDTGGERDGNQNDVGDDEDDGGISLDDLNAYLGTATTITVHAVQR